MIKAVVGANWGDEGKGKITDMLAEKADIIVRFQGGANAGHTIVNNYGKFALHTLPSGVFYGHTTSVIGNGVALNIPVFFKEYNEVVSKGVPAPKILISDRAQMVMPYHILFDQYEEERLGGKSFGSTKSGIAPFYSDKYAKIGFQVNELFDEDRLKEKLASVCETKNVLLEHLYHKPLLNVDELFAELMEYKKMVAPYVCDVSLYLNNALKEGKEILLEGQLGTLKDPDHGIYPMVTSSSTLAAYGAIGAGVPPYEIQKIVVVSKAYSSAVGAGAFVSEIFGELMTLIETSKRDTASVVLPNSRESFTVPSNVYIIGTMNTADRSLTALDAALRRRFSFEEIMPEPEMLREMKADSVLYEDVDGQTGKVDMAKILETINKRIEFLLDRDHTIGHAYFNEMCGENATMENLEKVFRNKIFPLLQEYFFDDYGKIYMILGDNGKPSKYQFVQKKYLTKNDSANENEYRNPFMEDYDRTGYAEDIYELPGVRYEINWEAFQYPVSYVCIYQKYAETLAEN